VLDRLQSSLENLVLSKKRSTMGKDLARRSAEKVAANDPFLKRETGICRGSRGLGANIERFH